ncbi:MAG: MerR family transcriptional regulator [Bacteroidetes bacterium]|nr:MerR family transcriptional regulator [Bacteroidota bacterium]
MSSEAFIPAGEFCAFHHVELSFVQTLHNAGLIELTVRDGVFFLSEEQLSTLEKFTRWHYDLEINTEGIEALSHLLERMDLLLEENRRLRNKLQRFED